MNKLLNDLINVLERQNMIYKDILEISRGKTKVIVEGRVSELDRMTGLEQKMVFRAGCLDKRREELLRQITNKAGINADRVSMGLLLDKAGDGLKERFLRIRNDLCETLGQLKEVNDLNSRLIEKSLEYIKLSLSIVTDNTSGIAYGGGDGGEKQQGLSLFDQRV